MTSSDVRVLQAKLDAAEREAQMFALERSKWGNERAAFQLQLQEAVDAERRRLRLAGLDTADANVKLLRDENDALTRQMDVLRSETSKQINALELSNARSASKITVLEKELEAKKGAVDSALRETQATAANMETVIKQLVDRNKKLEAELQRQRNDAANEVATIIEEHRTLQAELQQERRATAHANEERAIADRQLADAKQIHQQLLDEIDGLHEKLDRVEALARDAEHGSESLRAAEEETRLDLDVAMGKLEKADTHIKRLSDELAASTVEVTKLRHQVEHAEERHSGALRDKSQFALRVQQALVAASDDYDRLFEDMEAMVATVRDVLVDEGHFHADVAVRSRPPPIRPAEVKTPQQSPAPDAALLSMLSRLSDALNLMREDVVLSHRALVEETKRRREALRKAAALDEAIRAERVHFADLSAKLSEAEEDASREKANVAQLQHSLHQASSWMAEAQALGGERTQRMEQVLEEKAALEARITHVETEKQQLRGKIERLTDELVAAQAESARLLATCKQHKSELQHFDDDSARHRATGAALKAELEGLQQQLSCSRDEAMEHRARVGKLETDNMHLHRQLSELDRAAKNKESIISRLEQDNTDLRDKLFESQKRLDKALRREPSSAALTTPLRQNGSAYIAPTSPNAVSTHTASSAQGGEHQYNQGSRIVNADRAQDWERRLNAILQRAT